MKEENINNRELKTTETNSNSELSCQVIQPNSFINGDCMEFMRTCPPNFFDLAIVDPPYGIGEDGSKRRVSPKRPNSYNHWEKHKKKNWDIAPPPFEYFEELRRVSKNQIIFGANHFISRIPFDSPCWIVWNKNIGGDFADCELAWTSFPTAVRIFTMHPFTETNGGKNRIHPTQKPLGLYRWILKRYAKAGDLILDTHVGSASSLIACVELGFDYVGFEIDKEYYTMAKSRLGRATRKYELFEAV